MEPKISRAFQEGLSIFNRSCGQSRSDYAWAMSNAACRRVIVACLEDAAGIKAQKGSMLARAECAQAVLLVKSWQQEATLEKMCRKHFAATDPATKKRMASAICKLDTEICVAQKIGRLALLAGVLYRTWRLGWSDRDIASSFANVVRLTPSYIRRVRLTMQVTAEKLLS
jgi:hypothetical protein